MLSLFLPLAQLPVAPSTVSDAIFLFVTDSCEASPCPFIAVMTETCWLCSALSARFPASFDCRLLQCYFMLFCFVLLFLLLLNQPCLFTSVCCGHSALLLLRPAGWMFSGQGYHCPVLSHFSPLQHSIYPAVLASHLLLTQAKRSVPMPGPLLLSFPLLVALPWILTRWLLPIIQALLPVHSAEQSFLMPSRPPHIPTLSNLSLSLILCIRVSLCQNTLFINEFYYF